MTEVSGDAKTMNLRKIGVRRSYWYLRGVISQLTECIHYEVGRPLKCQYESLTPLPGRSTNRDTEPHFARRSKCPKEQVRICECAGVTSVRGRGSHHGSPGIIWGHLVRAISKIDIGQRRDTAGKAGGYTKKAYKEWKAAKTYNGCISVWHEILPRTPNMIVFD